MGVTVLNRLDSDGSTAATSLALTQFLLAEALHVDPAELLQQHQSSPPPTATAQEYAALLGALLHDLSGAVPAVIAKVLQ